MTTMTPALPAVKSSRKPLAASLTLTINGVPYAVEKINPGEFGTVAYHLEKQAKGGETYDVIRTHDGLVECSCPSYEMTYRGTVSTCKHGQALVAVGLVRGPAYLPATAVAVVEPIALVVEPIAPAVVESGEAGVARVLDASVSLPPSIASAARDAGVSFGKMKRAILGRFMGEVIVGFTLSTPTGEATEAPETVETEAAQVGGETTEAPAVAPLPCCDPAETTPCRECVPSLPSPAPGRRRFGFGILDDDDAQDAAEPFSEQFYRAISGEALDVAMRPVKLAPLPNGKYDLAGLVDAQAAFLRGVGNAPFTLMADTLADLARSIRQTGAKTIADYQDRLAVMEADHRRDELETAYAAGFDSAMASLGTY